MSFKEPAIKLEVLSVNTSILLACWGPWHPKEPTCPTKLIASTKGLSRTTRKTEVKNKVTSTKLLGEDSGY